MSINIRLVSSGDETAWDAFVNEHPMGSFFHRFAWQGVFEKALGHDCHYLVAENESGLTGLLPLVHMRSRLFGSTLSSLPFATYAGVLASDESSAAALDDYALKLAKDLKVGALEHRLREASGHNRPTKSLYSCFYKELLPDEEQNMKAIRSKQRNIIRKGMKAGLNASVSSLDAFYPVYSESVRNLGTPVFPRKLFSNIASAFPDNTEFLCAERDGEVFSAAMLFYHGEDVCPYYWGGKYEARAVAGNDFLAFSIMNHAAARGCKRFDFGRSKADTGPFKWKQNLGFEAQQLYYEYDLVLDTAIPEVNPNNPKYELLINTWKRLPLPIAEIIGPMVSRTLG